MLDSTPALGLLIDLPLGLIMWAAILRFILTIFIKENSQFIGLRVTVGLTDPLVRLVGRMTPPWLIDRLIPLAAAFAIFILRYYVAPLFIDFEVSGFGDMPLESLLLSARGDIGF